MEHNLSSFHIEMREAVYIIEHLTSRSLVIIDELGRGTSNTEGVAIAYALAEHFITCNKINTSVSAEEVDGKDTEENVGQPLFMFVTHFSEVCCLAEVYPNAVNQSMHAALESCSPLSPPFSSNPIKTAEEHTNNPPCMIYSHQVVKGQSQIHAGYGINMVG